MNKLIRALSQRLILISIMITLLFVWGFYSVVQMKKEYLPQINNPSLMVSVQTKADTTSEAQINQMSEEMNQAIKSVDQVQSIELTIYPKGIFFNLSFPQNTDIKQAEESVKSALQTLSYPNGISRPDVTKISSDTLPFMEISLTSSLNSNSSVQASDIEDFQKQLEGIQGIQKMEATGAGQKGFVITIDNRKLADKGLTFEDIQNALKTDNTIWPKGNVDGKDIHFLLGVENPSINKSAIENLEVNKSGKEKIQLKDIADVESGIVHQQTIARTDGHPSILLNLYKTPSADVTKLSQTINDKMNTLQQNHNQKFQLKVLLDQGQMVSHAINGLWEEGILGCIFSIISVFFFFRQWRSTAAVLFSLPICFLATISILNTMGITLNLLTASGLIVSMGRVVDDSIVILDNIYRKLEQHKRFSFSVLSEGVKEMIPAVISSTFTTISVYLPLALSGNMVGQAFSGFAWAVSIALVCSLVVSLFLIPPFTAFSWGREFVLHAPPTEERAKPLLEKVFQKRKLWISCFCGTLLFSAAGSFFIPVNVFPQVHAKDINIQVESPEGSTLNQMDAEVKDFELLLSKHSEIQTYSSTTGSSFTPMFDDVFDQEGGWIPKSNVANVYVTPKPGVDQDQLISQIHQDIMKLSTSAVYTLSNNQISGDDSRVRIILSGASAIELTKAANLLKSKLQMINGLQIYGEGDQGDQQNFSIALNENKLKSLGIDKNAVLNRVELFMNKEEETSFTENGESVPIDLHKPSDISISYNQGSDPIQELLIQLGRLSFSASNGKKVMLEEFASLKVKPNSVLSFKDGQPITVVTGNIVSPDIEGVTQQINQTIADNHLPKGIHIDLNGIPQQMKEMIWSITFAGLVSILLVLLIITSIFKGVRAPLAILSSVPFSLIGSVIFLFLFKRPWDLGGLVGLVMLIGIVSTNGIVLVDRLERLRKEGKSINSAVIEGTASRVRPIIMTSFTTILTLLPLSFSQHSDSLISQSLSLVVVGGMITATLTTLLVTPSIYYWMYSKKERQKVRKTRSKLHFH